ncbi:NUDIX hydrolase [Neisseria zalophi]|uniref:DUF4743 domain-containing protein n=1 Tax=Neisseria zalophi TaxID=640030 RepID=A0A5J6PWG4_9NEIS|nr:DUF4743 domain-containing protein [Neisseria zalophi]QEY25182.1 DUF4743 domain-containing protein [Neisseria zalophi]
MTRIPYFTHCLNANQQNRLQSLLTDYFDSDSWQILWLNGLKLGRLNRQWRARIIEDWPAPIEIKPQGIHLHTANWHEMGEALQTMAQNWHRQGYLRGWRDEKFDVHNANGEPLFELERSAFRPLGLLSHAVHINGLTQHNGEWVFWIGRRAAHKAVDPNKLDNIVGGGIASGESIQEAMLREAEEEAGLSRNLLESLCCQSVRHSRRPVSRGLHNEFLHIFDAILPPDTRPENQDGEVAGFTKMTVPELTDAMCSGLLMNDAMLVTLDAFARYGLLDKNHKLFQRLAETIVPPVATRKPAYAQTVAMGK